jgi:ubiquinone/menaquinone biosynthesis C-methylase UbiE
MTIVWIVAALVAAFIAINLGWRWASRRWTLPCPATLAWLLESSVFERFNGTKVTLDRLGLLPDQQILEIGPGPGRLLIPAARRILPGGKAFGVELQPAMQKRLRERASQAGLTNLEVILGNATDAHVPEDSFDLVFLCAVLGEIPDRAAALRQCFRALKPGGTLSITEVAGDPHYQARSVLARLAREAGFQPRSVRGGWWLFTADFIKPFTGAGAGHS